MRHARAGGFTLVEVLVALVVMSVMAGLAWRGIDGLARAREITEARLDTTERLNTVLAQWDADLRALYDPGALGAPSPVPAAIECTGAMLRLMRSAEGGVQLVAWQLRGQRWMRWASPVVRRAGDLQEYWMRSQQLLGNEPEQLPLLDGVTGMQIYFYRGNAWTNCQSSAGAPTAPAGSTAAGNPAAPSAVSPAGVDLRLTVTQPSPGVLRRITVLQG